MHPELEYQPMPTVGSLHIMDTEDGRRVGVIRYDDARRQLVIYDPADPDARQTSALLTAYEADTIAELVGVTGPRQHCVRLDRHDNGVVVLQVLVGSDSPCVDRPLGQYGRAVTALIRGGRVLAAPARCRPGDVVVVIGELDTVLDAVESLTRRRPADRGGGTGPSG
jgi:TrkA domain protein